VQVRFGDFAAPVFYAQEQQINVQVPWELAGQTSAQLQIVYNGAAAGSLTVPVAPAAPGISVIENSDGTVNSPSNPARAGDFISIYGTGGGAMTPAGATGGVWPSSPLSGMQQAVSVAIGDRQAQVLYAGSAPTLATGYFQVNALVPPDAGNSTLVVTIGGASSAPVAIWIR